MPRTQKIIISAFSLLFFFVLASPTPASAAVASKGTPSNNGLVGYWSFNEGTSTKAMDYSGQGNTGTLTGSNGLPTWSAGKLGKGMTFDGTDDYVNIGSLDILNPTNETISVWIKPNTLSGSSGVVMMGNSAGDRYRGMDFNAGKLRFGWCDGAHYRVYSTNSVVFSTGQWTHVVAMQVSNGTPVIYINGVLQSISLVLQNGGVDPIPLPATFTTVIGRDGAYAASEYFNGSIDEVRVYSRALSAAEVLALYKAGGAKVLAAPSVGGLVGYWSFNSADMLNGVALDRSGQNNSGNLFNIATSTFYTLGKVAQAFNFDGVNDYVKVPDSSAFDFQSGDFGISFWFKISTLGTTNDIFNKENNQWIAAVVNSSNQLQVVAATTCGTWAINISSVSTVQANTWYQGIITRSGSSFKVYLNGVQEASATISSAICKGSDSLYFGSLQSLGRYFTGSIDEPRIYNRALSQAEVTNLYNATKGPVQANSSQTTQQTSGLVGYWSMNGADVTDKIYDRIGGNNGYLYNGATSSAKVIGKLGQGFKYDGVNDNIQVPSSSSLQFSGQFSASLWIKTTSLNSTGYSTFISNENYLVSGWEIFDNGPSSSKILFRVGPTGSNDCDIAMACMNRSLVNDGKWHHIVGVRSATQMELYLDGVLQDTGSLGTFTNNTDIYYVGSFGGSSGGSTLDEVRVYNRALSAAEVQQLYLRGK